MIKIKVRNTNNYVFYFNKVVDIEAADLKVLLKLYTALDLLFRKENNLESKNYISPNQTNILNQISDVGEF